MATQGSNFLGTMRSTRCWRQGSPCRPRVLAMIVLPCHPGAGPLFTSHLHSRWS